MTPEQRDELQNSYVNQVIEDMDLSSLIQLASDLLDEHLDKVSNEDLVDTVKELYPKLLNDT